jgi:hypothetical protein
MGIDQLNSGHALGSLALKHPVREAFEAVTKGDEELGRIVMTAHNEGG